MSLPSPSVATARLAPRRLTLVTPTKNEMSSRGRGGHDGDLDAPACVPTRSAHSNKGARYAAGNYPKVESPTKSLTTIAASPDAPDPISTARQLPRRSKVGHEAEFATQDKTICDKRRRNNDPGLGEKSRGATWCHAKKIKTPQTQTTSVRIGELKGSSRDGADASSWRFVKEVPRQIMLPLAGGALMVVPYRPEAAAVAPQQTRAVQVQKMRQDNPGVPYLSRYMWVHLKRPGKAKGVHRRWSCE